MCVRVRKREIGVLQIFHKLFQTTSLLPILVIICNFINKQLGEKKWYNWEKVAKNKSYFKVLSLKRNSHQTVRGECCVCYSDDAHLLQFIAVQGFGNFKKK